MYNYYEDDMDAAADGMGDGHHERGIRDSDSEDENSYILKQKKVRTHKHQSEVHQLHLGLKHPMKPNRPRIMAVCGANIVNLFESATRHPSESGNVESYCCP